MRTPSFALIGVAGFVAPRHLRAIKEVGAELKVAVDPKDSVGVIDSYFPQASFFTEFERFDRYVDRSRREGEALEYVSVCSPNYLHDSHVRFALRSGADAICEKPLVLNARNIDGLEALERDTGRTVNTILQLRLHPAILALRDKVAAAPPHHVHDVELTYITPRGRWYHVSWKGDEAKSGGIATNIGVHFYDMLGFVFGKVKANITHHRDCQRAAGYLEFERAKVRWFLSIDAGDLPPGGEAARTTYRSITVDGEEVEFSGGFTDLHTESYRAVLAGRGFRLDEVRPSIEIVSSIRTAPLQPGEGETHPFLKKAS